MKIFVKKKSKNLIMLYFIANMHQNCHWRLNVIQHYIPILREKNLTKGCNKFASQQQQVIHCHGMRNFYLKYSLWMNLFVFISITVLRQYRIAIENVLVFVAFTYCCSNKYLKTEEEKMFKQLNAKSTQHIDDKDVLFFL